MSRIPSYLSRVAPGRPRQEETPSPEEQEAYMARLAKAAKRRVAELLESNPGMDPKVVWERVRDEGLTEATFETFGSFFYDIRDQVVKRLEREEQQNQDLEEELEDDLDRELEEVEKDQERLDEELGHVNVEAELEATRRSLGAKDEDPRKAPTTEERHAAQGAGRVTFDLEDTDSAGQVRAYLRGQQCFCSEEPDGREGFVCSRCLALDHLSNLTDPVARIRDENNASELELNTPLGGFRILDDGKGGSSVHLMTDAVISRDAADYITTLLLQELYDWPAPERDGERPA